MKSRLLRSLTKVVVTLACLLCLAGFILSFAGGAFLNRFRPAAQAWISRGLRTPVSIGAIAYAFPDKILIKKARLFTNRPIIVVKEAALTFSLPEAVFHRRIVGTRLSLDGLDLYYPEMSSFIARNGKLIVGLLRSLPQPDMFTFDCSGAFTFFKKEDSPSRLYFQNTTHLRNGKFYGSGIVHIARLPPAGLRLFSRKYEPLSYVFTLTQTKDGFTIDALKCLRRTFFSSFWGSVSGSAMELNGYCYATASSGIKDTYNIFGVADHHKESGKLFGHAPSQWDIFDIDCRLAFEWPVVAIKNLSFSLNDTPLGLSGNLVLNETGKFDLRLVSYPNQTDSTRAANPKHFEAALNGMLKEGAIDGAFDFAYLRRAGNKLFPEGLRAGFKGLSLNYLRDDRLKVHAANVEYTYHAAAGDHVLSFTDFSAVLAGEAHDGVHTISISSNLYDGFCEMSAGLNLTKPPYDFNCDIGITAVTAQNLATLLAYFHNVEGKVSGKMRYRYGDSGDFSGKLILHDGVLKNFSFFTWLADSFGIEALKNIKYDTLSFNFFINNDVMRLEDINIRSPSVILEGYYDINDGLAASKLSLSLQQSLLSQSPRFSPLVRLLGKNFDFFTFDFQLSGLADAVNFKWLDSQFKERLHHAIPGFVERGIEAKVEMIIAAPAEKSAQ